MLRLPVDDGRMRIVYIASNDGVQFVTDLTTHRPVTNPLRFEALLD